MGAMLAVVSLSFSDSNVLAFVENASAAMGSSFPACRPRAGPVCSFDDFQTIYPLPDECEEIFESLGAQLHEEVVH